MFLEFSGHGLPFFSFCVHSKAASTSWRDHEVEECEAPYVYRVKRRRMELRSHHHFKVVLPETLPPPLGPHYRGLSHHNTTPMMVARPLWHTETNQTTTPIHSPLKCLTVLVLTVPEQSAVQSPSSRLLLSLWITAMPPKGPEASSNVAVTLDCGCGWRRTLRSTEKALVRARRLILGLWADHSRAIKLFKRHRNWTISLCHRSL